MRIVFWGSDDFAAAHLKALIDSRHVVAACVTQPDKPKGRGWKISGSPVKQCAREHKISVLQPVCLKDDVFLDHLRRLGSDLFVVVAYGQFLPGKVLAVPHRFAVNVHSSLLPKYRGAAPINWAVINGEKETGISIMKISGLMDAGDILLQKEMAIARDDTAVMLRVKMSQIGPPLLLEAMDNIERNTHTLTPQAKGAATFAPKLTKDLGYIRWGGGAEVIHNLARGLVPWPAAHTFYNGKLLKILETEVVGRDFPSVAPGEVAEINKEGFVVCAGENGLRVKRVHLESSRPMAAHDFAVGHKLGVGFRFA
jgi:methionyl-tRNA formyltransferase